MATSIQEITRAASVGAVVWFLLCAVFASVATAQVKPPNWKVFGFSQLNSKPVILFFSAGEVHRLPDGHAEVWTKALNQEDIKHAMDSMDKAHIDRVAKKIAGYYLPPYSLNHELTQDEMISVVTSEEYANDGGIQPSMRILYELDCSKRLYRELSIYIADPENPQHVENASEWKHVPPETTAADLRALVCPSN